MRPIFGWGAGSFPYIFYENAYLEIPLNKYQHTHNLVIELAYNFGIPIALFITSTIFTMFIKVLIKIKKLTKESYSYLIYKPFLASFSIFLIAHLTDITYYDGKISILFALLLANLKNIFDEKIELKDKSKIHI
jgi:O-antigen ligase